MAEENDHTPPPVPIAGRNFAAGMTGGDGYVVDANHNLAEHCNGNWGTLQRPASPDDADQLRELIQQHHDHTRSSAAEDWLNGLPNSLGKVTKVVPIRADE